MREIRTRRPNSSWIKLYGIWRKVGYFCIVFCFNIIAILILGVQMRSCFFPTPHCVLLCVFLFYCVLEQGSIGPSKFLHFMTSLDRIPPLGLKRKIEVEFSINTNPTFFAETCGFVLRVPTVHETFEAFEDKLLEATENYLGYDSI